MESDVEPLLKFEKILHLNTHEAIFHSIMAILECIKDTDKHHQCQLEFFRIQLKNPTRNNWKDLTAEWASSKKEFEGK